MKCTNFYFLLRLGLHEYNMFLKCNKHAIKIVFLFEVQKINRSAPSPCLLREFLTGSPLGVLQWQNLGDNPSWRCQNSRYGQNWTGLSIASTKYQKRNAYFLDSLRKLVNK